MAARWVAIFVGVAQVPPPPVLSPDTQAMLDSLQLAVAKTLDRKRRLGHYVVQWVEGYPCSACFSLPTNGVPAYTGGGMTKLEMTSSWAVLDDFTL